MRRLTLLLVAVVASACTNFQDPTTVVDLRLLAVKVEPSEIILDADLSDPTMPVAANNPMVTVTPLIADPKGGGRAVTYSISACPNNPFAAAPPGGGQGGGAFPSGGARTTVGSALCDEGSDTTWPLEPGPIDAASPTKIGPSIDQLTAAFMKDVFPDQYGNLHGGFELGMPLTLDIRVDAGDEEIRGVKRVLYWLRRIDDQQVPNEIPTIDSVQMFYERDDATFDPIDTPQDLDDTANTFDKDITPGATSVWIVPSKGNAESYETTVLDPTTHQAVPFTVERETLRYRFFTTAGTFAPAVTSSEPDPGFVPKGPIHIESELRLPAVDQIPMDENGDRIVTIWIVVRDDRGGENWEERHLRVMPPP
jgi:hypothetical protein